ncbi:MAG: hypothetical protein MI749_07225 [Desulfovibrionales bacterium]|nr:hypothetical protein [Desulfovibrionales bacterium]
MGSNPIFRTMIHAGCGRSASSSSAACPAGRAVPQCRTAAGSLRGAAPHRGLSACARRHNYMI